MLFKGTECVVVCVGCNVEHYYLEIKTGNVLKYKKLEALFVKSYYSDVTLCHMVSKILYNCE